MAAKRSRKSPKRRKASTRRKAKAPKRRSATESLVGRKKPKKRRRTAAQKAATERMLAANRAKRGKKHHHTLPALPSHFRGHSGSRTLRPGSFHHHSHAPEAKTLVMKPRTPAYAEFED